MKTKRVFGIMIAGLLSLSCIAQENEKRFAFEISGGPSLATSELKSGKLEKGFGFEGILRYRLLSSTSIYAGWGWNRFTSDLSFAGNNTDFEETGYVFGLQYEHPINRSRSTYYLRAGGLYNHIEVENEEGEIIQDSKHGLGFQLGAGINIALGNSWSLSPNIKFNALTRDLKVEDEPVSMRFNYISVRLGVVKKF
jgi:opacity protein-like surface antigen